MAVIQELIRTEMDGGISFGNYELDVKSKLSDFEHEGDMYKVKTFCEITKLERNGMFVYESVPGTAVTGFAVIAEGVAFTVEGTGDVQITLGMEEDTEYKVLLNGENVGYIDTNLSGKLSFSVDLKAGKPVEVQVLRV